MSEAQTIETFKRTFLEYKPALTGLITRVLRGREDDVEDVLQEVWILGVRKFVGQEIRYPRSYLGRMAINAALMHLRPIARRERHETRDEEAVMELHDPRLDPESEIIRRNELRLMLEAVEALEPQQRESIRLRVVDGLTFDEIAETLGIRRVTARTRSHRTMAALRSARAVNRR